MEITKEQFETAHAKYPPSKMDEFFSKYLSQNAALKYSWVPWLIFIVLSIPFIMGMIGTILHVQGGFIKMCTITLVCLLLILGVPWIYTWYSHNFRLRKVRKELRVSREEYEILAIKFS